MTTREDHGICWALPYRGRIGCQISWTLGAIIDAHRDGAGIALYAAMSLRGTAQKYGDRYKSAFMRFAAANTDLLECGSTGPRGGFGYRPTPKLAAMLTA